MEQQNSSADQGYHLVVIHPFDTHAKGSIITDADEVADVLAGENARQVNKISAR
jgi:hypothetical protein